MSSYMSESLVFYLLFLLIFPVAPVQVILMFLLGIGKADKLIGSSINSSILVKELLTPSIPIFLIGLTWYIHQYRPDLINSIWPTKILYLVLLYDLITNIYYEYIINLAVTGAPIRIDKFLTGGLVWMIIGYLVFG